MTDAGFIQSGSPVDNLILSRHKTKDVILAENQDIVRGEVLGEITAGGEFITSLSAAVDGSEDVSVIALKAAVTGGAETQSIPVLIEGEVSENDLIFGAGHSIASTRKAMRQLSIVYRDQNEVQVVIP